MQAMQAILLALVLLLQVAARPQIARSRGGAKARLRLPSNRPSLLAQTTTLLSGGLAGTVASTITCPLEVVKTQLQSSGSGKTVSSVVSAVYKADGWRGFWRGLPPTLLGIIPSRATYFWAYSTSKSILTPRIGEGTLNAVLSGAAAGITGNTITNPIWMVKTRMQLLPDEGQRIYGGYGDAIKTIYREEGIGGFYRGITASYWGCAEGCIQFVLYERLKGGLVKRQNEKRRVEGLPPKSDLPKLCYFCSAAVAKCVATVTTYPHEVARTRMREQARGGVFKYKGMIGSLRIIAREEGAAGLYAGIGTHTARVVPNSAIMFLAFEVVNGWLKGREEKANAT